MVRFVSSEAAAACLTVSADPCSSCYSDGPGAFSSGRHPGWLLKRPNQANSPSYPAFCSISFARSQSPRGSTTSDDSNQQHPSTSYECLPLGTTRGHVRLRYVWDGHRIHAVDEECLENGSSKGRFNEWLLETQHRLWRAFIPSHRDVTPDYWQWLQWRLTQRFFSSTMQNLSTQSLLMAVGMGAKKAVAASAAINWLLKDGVGRIARMTVATNFGQSFDSDLKRIRFITSAVFDVTIGCDFITPLFPQHFLLLASVANVGKAIALAASVATQPAFQQALCAGGNLADLTAKNQAQHMVIDMAALGVSALLMNVVKNSEQGRIMLPLCIFPLLASADLYAIYNELKSVQLKTLNRERGEMIAEQWLRSKRVPSAAEISQEEKLLLPPDVAGGFLPLRIVPVEQLVQTPDELRMLMRDYSHHNYMLHLCQPDRQLCSMPPGPLRGLLQPWRWRQQQQPQLLVSLSEDARGVDIVNALLEAAYFRQAVHDRLAKRIASGSDSSSSTSSSSSGSSGNSSSSGGGGGSRLLWNQAVGLLSANELDGLLRSSRQKAARTNAQFVKDLHGQGWKVKTFLLSTSEKHRYMRMDSHAKH